MNEFITYVALSTVSLLLVAVITHLVWNHYLKPVKTQFTISDYSAGNARLCYGAKCGEWHQGNGVHTDSFRAADMLKPKSTIRIDAHFGGRVGQVNHP